MAGRHIIKGGKYLPAGHDVEVVGGLDPRRVPERLADVLQREREEPFKDREDPFIKGGGSFMKPSCKSKGKIRLWIGKSHLWRGRAFY